MTRTTHNYYFYESSSNISSLASGHRRILLLETILAIAFCITNNVYLGFIFFSEFHVATVSYIQGTINCLILSMELMLVVRAAKQSNQKHKNFDSFVDNVLWTPLIFCLIPYIFELFLLVLAWFIVDFDPVLLVDAFGYLYIIVYWAISVAYVEFSQNYEDKDCLQEKYKKELQNAKEKYVDSTSDSVNDRVKLVTEKSPLPQLNSEGLFLHEMKCEARLILHCRQFISFGFVGIVVMILYHFIDHGLTLHDIFDTSVTSYLITTTGSFHMILNIASKL